MDECEFRHNNATNDGGAINVLVSVRAIRFSFYEPHIDSASKQTWSNVLIVVEDIKLLCSTYKSPFWINRFSNIY